MYVSRISGCLPNELWRLDDQRPATTPPPWLLRAAAPWSRLCAGTRGEWKLQGVEELLESGTINCSFYIPCLRWRRPRFLAVSLFTPRRLRSNASVVSLAVVSRFADQFPTFFPLLCPHPPGCYRRFISVNLTSLPVRMELRGNDSELGPREHSVENAEKPHGFVGRLFSSRRNRVRSVSRRAIQFSLVPISIRMYYFVLFSTFVTV